MKWVSLGENFNFVYYPVSLTRYIASDPPKGRTAAKVCFWDENRMNTKNTNGVNRQHGVRKVFFYFDYFYVRCMCAGGPAVAIRILNNIQNERSVLRESTTSRIWFFVCVYVLSRSLGKSCRHGRWSVILDVVWVSFRESFYVPYIRCWLKFSLRRTYVLAPRLRRRPRSKHTKFKCVRSEFTYRKLRCEMERLCVRRWRVELVNKQRRCVVYSLAKTDDYNSAE